MPLTLVLLYPKFRPIFTLWHVGLLLPMYAIYPLIVRRETTAYLVRCLILILLVTLAIRYGFNMIDIRFLAIFQLLSVESSPDELAHYPFY